MAESNVCLRSVVTKTASKIHAIFVCAFVACFVQPVFSQTGSSGVSIAIEGYSPVSYFERGVAELGTPEFSMEHEGETYYFTSAAQLATFRAAPGTYLPTLMANCPYSLLLGRQVAIDPTRFKIIGGRLLLFHNSTELDALKAWNDDPRTDAELLDLANRRFELLNF